MRRERTHLRILREPQYEEESAEYKALKDIIARVRQDQKEQLLQHIIDSQTQHWRSLPPEQQRQALQSLVDQFELLWTQKHEPAVVQEVSYEEAQEPVKIDPDDEAVLQFPEQDENVDSPSLQSQEHAEMLMSGSVEKALEYETIQMIRAAWDALTRAHVELTKANLQRSSIVGFFHRKVEIHSFKKLFIEEVSSGLDNNALARIVEAVHNEFYRCYWKNKPTPPALTKNSEHNIQNSLHLDDDGFLFEDGIPNHPTMQEQLGSSMGQVGSYVNRGIAYLREILGGNEPAKARPAGKVIDFPSPNKKKPKKPID